MVNILPTNSIKALYALALKAGRHGNRSYTKTNLGDATAACGDVSDFDDVVVFFVYLELRRLSEDSRPSTSISLASLFTGGSWRLTLSCY